MYGKRMIELIERISIRQEINVICTFNKNWRRETVMNIWKARPIGKNIIGRPRQKWNS